MDVQIASHTSFLPESVLRLDYILKTFLKRIPTAGVLITSC